MAEATRFSENETAAPAPVPCLLCPSGVSPPEPEHKIAHSGLATTTLCKCLGILPSSFLDTLQSKDLFYCSACTRALKQSSELFEKLEEIGCQLDTLSRILKENLLQAYQTQTFGDDDAQRLFNTATKDVRHNLVNALRGKSKTDDDRTTVETASSLLAFSPEFMFQEPEFGDDGRCDLNPMVSSCEVYVKQEIFSEDFSGMETAEDYVPEVRNFEANVADEKSSRSSLIRNQLLISEIKTGKKQVQIRIERLEDPESKTKSKRRKSLGKKHRIKLKPTERSHPLQKGDGSESEFRCFIEGCTAQFKHKFKRRAHMIQKHEEWKPFKCDVCQREFSRRNLLTQHLTIHGGEKPYVCEHCNSPFRQQRSLTNHYRVTHDIKLPRRRKRFPCPTCSKVYSTRTALDVHSRIHTGEKPYMCEICCTSFRQRSEFSFHQRKFHAEQLDLPDLRCKFCSKSFSGPTYLREHEKRHNGVNFSFNCDQCSYGCFRRSMLEKHQRTHSSERNFVCTVEGCGARYKYQQILDSHMRRHNNDRKYKCDICGKGFLNLGHMKNHKGAIHFADSKEFCAKNTCEFCGQGFPIRKYLMRHIEKTHRNDKSSSNAQS